MTERPRNDDFFYGVIVLKDGKWAPHAKFNGDRFSNGTTTDTCHDEKDDDSLEI